MKYKYTVHKLDRRHRFCDKFEYYVSFKSRMAGSGGPMLFNSALQWMIQTWGWSAEIDQYVEIENWADLCNFRQGTKYDIPPECNPRWSWTNRFEDLRIYFVSDAELAFFQLAHPVDQK